MKRDGLKRFVNSLRLCLRPVVGRHLLLFLLILFQMTLLFVSVDQSISGALAHYDYVGHFFDLTEDNFVALSLNNAAVQQARAPEGSRELCQKIAAACGETPQTDPEIQVLLGDVNRLAKPCLT